MKKTWIKIKRGLLEPKHRDALGIRIWLYLYMLDNVDWETGTIPNWTDKAAAKELQMSIRTLTTQRQELEDAGYISCIQKVRSQTITINNWTNPREYSGDVYNKGTRKRVPLGERVRETEYPRVTENRVPLHIIHIKESQYESLNNQEFFDSWCEFIEHRKEIKKPMTELAMKKMLKKLAAYPGSVAIAMLDQSIENGWQGVFPLKGAVTTRQKASIKVNDDGSLYV